MSNREHDGPQDSELLRQAVESSKESPKLKELARKYLREEFRKDQPMLKKITSGDQTGADQSTGGSEIPTTKHVWRDSREFFIGTLYQSIYPRYCECGAFMKGDGTILEPRNHCKLEECPAGKFCSTTQDRPDHMTPEECPLLKSLGLVYPKELTNA